MDHKKRCNLRYELKINNEETNYTRDELSILIMRGRSGARVNKSQNLWIFYPGKVSHFCLFWEEFPDFALPEFSRILSKLYNLKNSSYLGRDLSAHETFLRKRSFPRNLSQVENFPQEPFLGRNFAAQDTFPSQIFLWLRNLFLPWVLFQAGNLFRREISLS